MPCQRVQEVCRCDLDFQDLSARAQPLAAARTLALARSRLPHELSRSLVDVALYQLGEEDFFWYVNLNHLIADAWAVSLVRLLLIDSTCGRSSM